MHRVLVAAVLVSVVLAGCIDNVLPGGDELVQNTKVDVSENFSVQDAFNQDNPGEKVDRIQFAVTKAERNLRVEISVSFEQESPTSQIPSGNVTVNLTDPEGEVRRWRYTSGGSSETTVQDPASGLWDLVVRAQGEGSYTIQIKTDKPAQ